MMINTNNKMASGNYIDESRLTHRNLLDLMIQGLDQYLFSFIPTIDIASLSLSNKRWSLLINQDKIWKQFAQRYTDYDPQSNIKPKRQIIELLKQARTIYEPAVIEIFGSLEKILCLPVIQLDEETWGGVYAMNHQSVIVSEFEKLNAPALCRGTVGKRNWIAIQVEKQYLKSITPEVIAKYYHAKRILDFDPADYPATTYGVYFLWHRHSGSDRQVIFSNVANYFFEDRQVCLNEPNDHKKLKNLVKGEVCQWDNACTRKLRTIFPSKKT